MFLIIVRTQMGASPILVDQHKFIQWLTYCPRWQRLPVPGAAFGSVLHLPYGRGVAAARCLSHVTGSRAAPDQSMQQLSFLYRFVCLVLATLCTCFGCMFHS